MRLRRRLTASLLPLAGLLWAALLGAGLSLASIGAGHGDLVIVHGARDRSRGVMLAEAYPEGSAGGDDRVAAEQVFTERCAACHGADGRGKGPASASLKPRPVNFHDLKWQKSVSDDTIAKAIVNGGAAVGLSNQMMPNPDLEDQPGTVKALIARVRGFGK